VPKIPIIVKADGKRRSFLEWKKNFHKKQKLTRTVTLICWRLSYCLHFSRLCPGNDFVFMQDSVPCSHHAKLTQQFLWQNTPDFIAADEWASYSPNLNPFGISCRIWCTKVDDFRLRIYRTSVRQSKTSGRRSPLRQFENPLHSGKNDWMLSERRIEARFSTFSANSCDWISISSFTVIYMHLAYCTGWLKKWAHFLVAHVFKMSK